MAEVLVSGWNGGNRFTVWLLIAAVGFCAMGGGCDTKNIGPGLLPIGVTVSFSYLPDEPTAGEEVTFYATATTASGVITEYQWNFGDNGSDRGDTSTTTHVYAGAGTYTITLTVLDDNGTPGTATKVITIAEADGEETTCEDYVTYVSDLPCSTEETTEGFGCHDNLSDFCTGVGPFYQCRIDNTYCDDDGNLVMDIEQCDAILDCS